MQKLRKVMQREKEAKATWNLLYQHNKMDKMKRYYNVVRSRTGAEQRRQMGNNKWNYAVDRYSGDIVPGSTRSRTLQKLAKLQAAVRGAQYRAKNKPPMRKRLRNANYPQGRVYNARRRAVRSRWRSY